MDTEDIIWLGGPFLLAAAAAYLAGRRGPFVLWLFLGVLASIGVWYFARAYDQQLAEGFQVVDGSMEDGIPQTIGVCGIVGMLVHVSTIRRRWPIWVTVPIAGAAGALTNAFGYIGFGGTVATAITLLWALVKITRFAMSRLRAI